MEFNQAIVAVQLIKAIIICVLSVLIERMLLSSVVGSFVLTSKGIWHKFILSSFIRNQTVQL